MRHAEGVVPQARGLWWRVADLVAFRSLLKLWTLREIHVRYKQSLLGSAWAILQPLSLAIMFAVVFGKIIKVPTGNVPYPLFAYAGLLPWVFFSTAISTGTLSLVNNMNLVGKIYFPREILPLASVGTALADYGVAWSAMVLLMLWYRWPLYATVWWLLPLLLIEILLILGVALVGAAGVVYYRDVRFLVPVALQLWFYATPIIYPLDLIPARLQPLFALNPMTVVITGMRGALLYGTAPRLDLLLVGTLTSIVVCALGYVVFKRAERGFADII
jgi:ABC-type polysaccharide/polyol phosphate export permease